METPVMISKIMMMATIIPIFAPVLRLGEPPDPLVVELAAEAVVIAIWVVVKTVPLIPMAMPAAGCCWQPACSATITKTKVSKKSPYSVPRNEAIERQRGLSARTFID